MEEDDIFESDELSIDEATSSYADDIKDSETYDDPTVGTIIGFVEGRYSKAEKARYSDEQRWIKAYQNYEVSMDQTFSLLLQKSLVYLSK